MGEVVISVNHVSKLFRLYASPQDRLKEALDPRRRVYHKEHWVFRDLSLQIVKGEFVGIIGRNGCGKSTLLKLISGVLVPTSGRISVRGSISALLELGSGMNPQFTGMENIFFYGTILGLERDAIQDELDNILAFADIGEYVDQPIKRYSSGMKARLAFAVASHLMPDILIIDEALAVGDVFFRQKCHARIERLLSEDIAVLLVSHSLADVARYCSRAMFLHNGEVMFDGEAKTAVTYFQNYFRTAKNDAVPSVNRLPGSTSDSSAHVTVGSVAYQPGWELPFWPQREKFCDLAGVRTIGISAARCTGVVICDAQGRPSLVFGAGDWAELYYEFVVQSEVEIPAAFFRLRSTTNVVVHGKASFQTNQPHPTSCPIGTVLRFVQRVQLNVTPGQYTLELGFGSIPKDVYADLTFRSRAELQAAVGWLDYVEGAATVVVSETSDGVPAWSHLGLCDLPNDCTIGMLEFDAGLQAQPRVAMALCEP